MIMSTVRQIIVVSERAVSRYKPCMAVIDWPYKGYRGAMIAAQAASWVLLGFRPGRS